MQTLHFSLVVQYWINYMRFLIQSKSVQFSHSIVSDSLQPHGLQHARPPCPSPSPRVHSNSCPSSQWCHPAISSSIIPLLLLPPIPPSIRVFQWVNSSHEVAKVLEFQLQHHSFQRNPRADLLQNGLVGSPCSPRDSQESSPTPQFRSINSSALTFLYGPSRYMTCICTVFLNLEICFIKLDMLKSWTDPLMSSVYEYVYMYVSNFHIRTIWYRKKEWFYIILSF